jgi:hypothetical protein
VQENSCKGTTSNALSGIVQSAIARLLLTVQ